MDERPVPVTPPHDRNFRGWLGDMPRWKKASLLAAIALLVTGAVFMAIDPGTAASSGSSGGGASGTGGSVLQSTLLPDQPGGGTTTTTAAESEPTAKGVFRLGFSFLAGFCLGSFVRATLRIASIAIGFWLAMTLVLSYYGLVDVNWQSIDGVWNRFVGNIEAEWGSFQTFITGSLPAAGLVATGFAIGVKRH